VDEVRRAEFFRRGGAARDLVRGKRWLLLTSWLNLDRGKRCQLNAPLALNRGILKAYLKESLSQLWNYTYEGAMLRYLQSWIDQLRWQRLKPMQKLARMLLDHLEGILNYCRTKIPMGVIEAVNGNIKALLRRGRGYRDMNYLLLKAQRLAATKTNSSFFRKPHSMHSFSDSCSEPKEDTLRPILHASDATIPHLLWNQRQCPHRAPTSLNYL
jgi:transposase